MEYKVDDKALSAAEFIPFVNQVWPGDYDMDRMQAALSQVAAACVFHRIMIWTECRPLCPER